MQNIQENSKVHLNKVENIDSSKIYVKTYHSISFSYFPKEIISFCMTCSKFEKGTLGIHNIKSIQTQVKTIIGHDLSQNIDFKTIDQEKFALFHRKNEIKYLRKNLSRTNERYRNMALVAHYHNKPIGFVFVSYDISWPHALIIQNLTYTIPFLFSKKIVSEEKLPCIRNVLLDEVNKYARIIGAKFIFVKSLHPLDPDYYFLTKNHGFSPFQDLDFGFSGYTLVKSVNNESH